MKRWYSVGTACVLAALLSACAAPALTPERVGQLAYAALGPEMQMGDELTLVWLQAPGATTAQPVANPEAEAARSPMLPDLALALSRGARESVNLAVGGPDSAYAAQVLLQALRAVLHFEPQAD